MLPDYPRTLSLRSHPVSHFPTFLICLSINCPLNRINTHAPTSSGGQRTIAGAHSPSFSACLKSPNAGSSSFSSMHSRPPFDSPSYRAAVCGRILTLPYFDFFTDGHHRHHSCSLMPWNLPHSACLHTLALGFLLQCHNSVDNASTTTLLLG